MCSKKIYSNISIKKSCVIKIFVVVDKMSFSNLNDDTKTYIIEKFYPDCEEAKERQHLLLHKLFILYEGNFSCVRNNHQRIKQLCT